jgi:hypothetical protein
VSEKIEKRRSQPDTWQAVPQSQNYLVVVSSLLEGVSVAN